ncbi:unnamed protein product [Acanthoscelides obtectus]|uniref:Hcy-binding domain-containing protein n=1 Tax=Acanthoscelides obtectus TaxID=200917 RepID=A0A9P0L129_ACAOB|nr:unnamed protein product [Acanthoscelides obtectus]CAK1673167.1 Homocysteine S-methyltransferase 1 [Acanthoscelides obtectus]
MDDNKIKLLDGSYGFQLNKHLEKPVDHDPLWSSRALITDPEAVIKTHMDYIHVGVDIIETNTYQASIEGFMQYLNISKEESYKLIQKAVDLARMAVDQCEKKDIMERETRLTSCNLTSNLAKIRTSSDCGKKSTNNWIYLTSSFCFIHFK